MRARGSLWVRAPLLQGLRTAIPSFVECGEQLPGYLIVVATSVPVPFQPIGGQVRPDHTHRQG